MNDVPAGPATEPSPWPSRLLAVYPPAWRARYGEEVDLLVKDLSEHGHAAIPMAIDLLCGAAAAWLFDRRIDMSERSREALIRVLWSWVAFATVATWFGHDLGIYPTAPAAHELASAHPVVPDAYHVLLAAGVFGVAATAVAALVYALDAGRNAARAGRWRTFALMAVPVLIGAAWIAGTRLLHGNGPETSGKLTFAVAWLLLGIAGIAISTQAVVTVIRSSEFSESTWRIGGAAAAAVTAAMAVATLATLTWGIAVRTSLTHPGDATGWLVVSAIMAVTTGRAVLAMVGTHRHAPETPAVA